MFLCVGLPLSLMVGMKYAKYLCCKHNKPIIPIHHMEAHALTARMSDKSVKYPFLVLLISGGHCLLAVVKNVDEFILLGQSLDDAPGEAFDKVHNKYIKQINLWIFINFRQLEDSSCVIFLNLNTCQVDRL